ncbi:Glutamyl-tRNA reductase HemA [Helicobacter bizzozeronii]|nr:Glutamyl-tRNA reductase HemA [Helicobacter bizzozeronii]
MDSGYLVLGFTHKHLPIELREQLAFGESELLGFLNMLKHQHPHIKEIMALCTCNRVEFYLYAYDLNQVACHLIAALAQAKQMPLSVLQSKSEIHTQTHAIHHVFCVASSLDSMVVGETQITGQFKSAYKMCLEHKLCAQHLTRLAHFAFKCAAAVRNSTTISSQVVSIASMAVKQALEVLESEKVAQRAVVVGVGEMGQLVCKHLLAKGFEVILCNRHKERALELGMGLEVQDFENLPVLINTHPFLFCATGANHPIITPQSVISTDFRRWWFDLGVPRNIAPIQEPNIWLYSVDDLQSVVAHNLENRQKDTSKAYEIAGLYTHKFLEWLQTLEVDPLIKGLRDLAREAALKELRRALKKGFLPPQYEESVAKILHSAFNTFLHHPTAVLKKNAHKEEGDMLGECLKNLFNLGGENMFVNRYKCEYEEGC